MSTVRPLRDAVGAALCIFGAIATCIGWMHVHSREHEINEVRGDLRQLATIASSLIDGDLQAKLRSPEQMNSPEHQAALAPLVHLHRQLPDVTYVYTAILQDEEVRLILDTSTAGNAALGTDRKLIPSKIMDLYDDPDPEMVTALRDHKIHAAREPYHDEFGTFISGYAPIFDSQNQFQGVVGIDQSAADLETRLSAMLHIELSALFGGAVISGILGMLVYRTRCHSLRAERERTESALALTASEQRYRAAALAAESADRAKSDFLAMMSHELRTPLTGMLGFNELLSETELSLPQRELAGLTKNCGQALLTVIDDILIYSKIEAGRLELEEQPFALRDCLEEVLAVCAAPLGSKPVELCYEMAEAVTEHLLGDVTRLRQVLFNLIGNAVKFTQSGEVIVRVTQAADHASARLLFEVQDSGPGIPADRQERLFRPFTQADSSTTRRYGGTGLGLAICQRLVSAMGGEIGVKSTPGEGATFFFTLPKRAAAQVTVAARPEFAGRSVLLVEPPSQARTLRVRLFESWGLRTHVADSPQSAQQRFAHGLRYGALVLGEVGQAPDAAAYLQALGPLETLPPCVLLVSLTRREAFSCLPLPPRSMLLNRPTRHADLSAVFNRIWSGPASEPLAPPVAMTQREATLRDSAPKLKVLLAEDTVMNQLLLTTLLGKLGCETKVVGDGLSAVQQTAAAEYDLVLMDLQMPELSGLEATAEIRAREQRESFRSPLRIVALTASAMEGERDRCLAAGMDDYLVKPIQFAALKALIERTAGACRLAVAA